MKTYILLLILITISSTSYAQIIEVERSINGYTFVQDEKDLSLTELMDIFKANEETSPLAHSVRINYITSQALSITGAAFVTYPIVKALVMGESTRWTAAYIGSGLIVISVPFRLKSISQMKDAVAIYNSNQMTTTYRFQPSFNLVSNGNGIGVSMLF